MAIVIKPSPETHPSGVLTCFHCRGRGCLECRTPEEEETPCPACKQPVKFKWLNGVVYEPHHVLIADWLYHTECWDKIEKEFPPNGGPAADSNDADPF